MGQYDSRGAEILRQIDEYERDKKQEAEVLGAMREAVNARERWIAAAISFLNVNSGFQTVDKFQGDKIARWLRETKGRLTTTTWKAAWLVAKKYQGVEGVGRAPDV